MKKLLPIFGFVILSGCAVPVPVQIASWILDGVSLVATQKSVNDHVISIVAQQDCALFRGFTEGQVCRNWDGEPSALFAVWENNYSEGKKNLIHNSEYVDQYAYWEKKYLQSEEETLKVAERKLEIDTEQNNYHFSKSYGLALGPHITGRASYPEKQQLVQDSTVNIAESKDRKNQFDPLNSDILIAHVDDKVFKESKIETKYSVPIQLVLESNNKSLRYNYKSDTHLEKVSQKTFDLDYQKSVANKKQNLQGAKKKDPTPGFYFVIGSFRNVMRAHGLSKLHSKLNAGVLSAKLNNGTTFRVVVGPFFSREEPTLRRTLYNAGIRDPWAINIKPGDWTSARVEENRQLASVPSNNY